MNKNSDISQLAIMKIKNFKKLKIKINNKVLKIKNKNANVYNILSSLALLNELNLNFKRNYFEEL